MSASQLAINQHNVLTEPGSCTYSMWSFLHAVALTVQTPQSGELHGNICTAHMLNTLAIAPGVAVGQHTALVRPTIAQHMLCCSSRQSLSLRSMLSLRLPNLLALLSPVCSITRILQIQEERQAK